MESFATATDLMSAHVMAAIAAVLLLGAGLSHLARRLGQPPVTGEIAAGILLGPSLLGLLPGDPTAALFPTGIRPMLGTVAQFGLLLFLFLIGWEFNKHLVDGRRAAAGAVSVSSVLVAFGLGSALAVILYPQHDLIGGATVDHTGFVLFIGTAMAVTAFPVLARILDDCGLLGTRAGALALAGAAVDDVIAWCLLACVSAVVTASGPGTLIRTGVLSVTYVVFMVVVLRPLLGRLVHRLSVAEHPAHLLPVLAAGVFLSSYITTWIGVHAIFGAFFFGLVMPREATGTTGLGTVTLASARATLDGVAAVMMPVFFIVTGLSVDIGALQGQDYLELAGVLVVACAGKFVGACVPARAAGLPWREVGVLGVLMNTRGLTELIILDAGVRLGVLDTRMFTMMVLMALFTTALAGPLLSVLLRQPLADGAHRPEPRPEGVLTS